MTKLSVIYPKVAGLCRSRSAKELQLLETMSGKDTLHGIDQTPRNMEEFTWEMELKTITSALCCDLN